MTKAHSEAGDNGGICEGCNDPETKHQFQQTFPVELGGGLGAGTMWLCPKCFAKKQAKKKYVCHRCKQETSMPPHFGVNNYGTCNEELDRSRICPPYCVRCCTDEAFDVSFVPSSEMPKEMLEQAEAAL